MLGVFVLLHDLVMMKGKATLRKHFWGDMLHIHLLGCVQFLQRNLVSRFFFQHSVCVTASPKWVWVRARSVWVEQVICASSTRMLQTIEGIPGSGQSASILWLSEQPFARLSAKLVRQNGHECMHTVCGAWTCDLFPAHECFKRWRGYHPADNLQVYCDYLSNILRGCVRNWFAKTGMSACTQYMGWTCDLCFQDTNASNDGDGTRQRTISKYIVTIWATFCAAVCETAFPKWVWVHSRSIWLEHVICASRTRML